jgi:hypothetical protein
MKLNDDSLLESLIIKIIEIMPEHISSTKRKELYSAILSEVDISENDEFIAFIYDIDDELDKILVDLYPSSFDFDDDSETDEDTSDLNFDDIDDGDSEDEDSDEEELWENEEL